MSTRNRLTRREFTHGSAALLGATLVGCSGQEAVVRKRTMHAGKRPPPVGEVRYTPPAEATFPVLEARGKPYEIGFAVGKRFASQIRGGFEDRSAWWRELKAFADAQPQNVFETFLAAAKKHAPDVVEELRGWADGCGLPFRDMMILNLKAEYGALRDKSQADALVAPAHAACPGCSTVVVKDGKRFIHVHNEDGDKAYDTRMFMLRLRPEGKPAVFCASYPGVLPGNAPWINDAGVIMTTNFIYSKEVRLGVGRYFLDRLSMEARSPDEALKTCKHPERAYAFHHVISCTKSARVVSLEVTPSEQSQVEVNGLFLHTNHLVHEKLASAAQDQKYVGSSSMSRWQVLNRWKDSLGEKPVGQLKDKDLVQALSSHDGRPYSPCRHPEGKIGGSTLLTAVFQVPGDTVRVFKNQPCLGKHHDFRPL
jgi:isopenicillin-N N-acyltransferase-like protein